MKIVRLHILSGTIHEDANKRKFLVYVVLEGVQSFKWGEQKFLCNLSIEWNQTVMSMGIV